jgi:hypothetical protein
MKAYIGIDNGVTGSIGIIEGDKHAFIATPVIKCVSYTKDIQHIQRINWRELLENMPKESIALIERPMVNPRAFKATQSALRSLEATIIVLEMLDIQYSYIDSKTWQREFIASSIIGHDDLKKASMQIGLKLFPSNGIFIKKHKDADGLLIAEYLRRQQSK